MPNQQQYPVFVYGTLRRGGGLHFSICGMTARVTPLVVRGFTLYRYGVPYLGIGPLYGHVTGDLISIRPDRYHQALNHLDGIESFRPHRGYALYIRALIPTEAGPAWTYLAGDSFDFDPKFRVEGGDIASIPNFFHYRPDDCACYTRSDETKEISHETSPQTPTATGSARTRRRRLHRQAEPSSKR